MAIFHGDLAIGAQLITFFKPQNNLVGKIFFHEIGGNKIENYRKVS